MSWPQARLGDFVTIQTGKLDVNAGSEDGIYPFFTCSKKIHKINTWAYDCESILVAGNGDLNVKYYSGKFNAYQRTYIIESLSKEKLFPKYLYYFMEKYIDRLRQDSIGGVIKYIKLGNLTEAVVPLPPLSEQKRIAEILDCADAIRRTRQETLKTCDELLRSTFLEMFGDPVTNPMGWEVRELGEVIFETPTNGLYKSADEIGEGIRYLANRSLFHGFTVDLDDSRRAQVNTKELEKFGLSNGDLLMNRVSVAADGVGKVAMIENLEGSAIFESNMMRIKLNSSLVIPLFASHYLNQSSMRTLIINKSNVGNQASINQKAVCSIPIFVPPMSEQTLFEERVQSVLNARQSKQLASLDEDTLFNSLVQSAFRGEL